ncbi:unnamed protein product, partial [Medioppia subpectinata]
MALCVGTRTVTSRSLDYQMFICDTQQQSAAAWLAAAMNEVRIDNKHKPACRQPQTVQPFSRPNSRGVRMPASILRPCSAPVSPTGDISSPPVSPNGEIKKNVRFADSAPGGQLECVKYYALSPVPIRRRSLPRANSLPTDVTGQQQHYAYFIKPTFANPSLRADQFADRLHRQSVCLHSVSTTGTNNIVYGLIAVRNHTYAKRVAVRYSSDDWRSAVDTVADYSHTSCGADMFTFAIDCKPLEFTQPMATTGAQRAPPVAPFNQRLHFVCRYETATGDQYWDNNDGHDYCVNLLVNDY